MGGVDALHNTVDYFALMAGLALIEEVLLTQHLLLFVDEVFYLCEEIFRHRRQSFQIPQRRRRRVRIIK